MQQDILHKTEQPISVLLVIPTYNNRNTLRNVVEDSMKTGLKILVVNDGSTDGGPDTIADLEVERLELPKNKGKGIAIQAAAKWAQENEYTHIITMDADGQHSASNVPKFVEKINENPLSIVLGARDFDSTDTPESSRFGCKFSNFWVRVSTGISVSDSQSGFRAYPVDALRRLHCLSRRYNFEVEILVKGIWAGLAVQSVNIAVNYNPETIEASHFRPFVDNFRISLTYTYLVTRNLFPLPHRVLYGQKPAERIKSFFLNPFRGLKLLVTEKSSPRQIMFAVMLGIFLATLPLVAIHSVAIAFVATRLKLNRLIALNVSHFCAPPFVPGMAVELGYFLRNGKFLTEFTVQTLGHEALQRVGDYLLGSIFLAPILAVLAGLITYLIIIIYRKIKDSTAVKKEVRDIA
jgi:glycosyltransferase involved in cell wall biosynthesis